MLLPVKSKLEISQNFVAFSEYTNFTNINKYVKVWFLPSAYTVLVSLMYLSSSKYVIYVCTLYTKCERNINRKVQIIWRREWGGRYHLYYCQMCFSFISANFYCPWNLLFVVNVLTKSQLTTKDNMATDRRYKSLTEICLWKLN